jgi:hypothetical protein
VTASRSRTSLPALAAILVAACGAPKPTDVGVVITLRGAAGQPVHGVDLALALPADAELEFDRTTGRIGSRTILLAPGAVRASVDGTFTPHKSTPSVRLLVASQVPLRDGELLVLVARQKGGGPPNVVRYEVASSRIAGADGQPMAGASAWVSGVRAR